MQQFPYPYYFYGSADSTDKDVLISLPQNQMPPTQEERKRLVKKLEIKYELDWNATLIVITDGHISDTIYPKAWIDGLNNAFYRTYALHKQQFPLPIKGKLPRNYLLAIYKVARTVLTLLTRSHYRPVVRPILKGIHPFHLKIDALKQIDLLGITDFKQKNAPNIDIWKTLAFYIGQNISLVKNDLEIYTKQELVAGHPGLKPMIYRQNFGEETVHVLQNKLQEWLEMVENRGEYVSTKNHLCSLGEKIDMLNETSIATTT